jgi:hypothetical protein
MIQEWEAYSLKAGIKEVLIEAFQSRVFTGYRLGLIDFYMLILTYYLKSNRKDN